jgi:tripartite-type tricarboxylate transporter receptor subunit TctC
MNRRELLKAAAALPLAQAALTSSAFAQTAWPTRNITMIVPFPAGGQADLAARPVALALERILGKPVIVDTAPAAPADRSATRRRRAPSRTATRY